MRRRTRPAGRALAVALIAAWSLTAAPAAAHKLKVFASVIDGSVDGSVYFVGGGAATGAIVTIETADGAPVTTVTTDSSGRFRFVPSVRAALRITADAGDGHIARLAIPADQLGRAGSPVATPPGTTAVDSLAVDSRLADAGIADAGAMAALVEAAVARQIRPLREQLNGYEDRVRWRDVLGGLGYIVGLAGLAAWLTGRRRRGAAE